MVESPSTSITLLGRLGTGAADGWERMVKLYEPLIRVWLRSRGLVAARTQVDAGSIVFDPYDYAFQEDPYPVYRRCRDEDPLHHNVEHDFWVLTRHADVQHAVRTEGVYSNAMGVSIDKSAWGPDAHKVMSFLGMDPPRQKRLRSLVSKGFTPRRVTELAPRIE